MTKSSGGTGSPLFDLKTNLGAFVIDSIPPAIIQLYSPHLILLAASITAFRADPHTLLTVYAAVVTGKPACIATCLAGAWPEPACNTCPKINSSTKPDSGLIFVLESNSLTVIIPNSMAE
ncbi:MAG: Uncharacterised protein [Methanobacteriota archaeon]|nr:MAG: Uncharacterised protein [Euryarchaeota archaeon]